MSFGEIDSASAGLSPQSIGIDWLHVLSLGVIPHALANWIWDYLLANPYAVQGPMASVTELGVARLRAGLFDWYGREDAADRKHTRVQQFLPSMIGTDSNRKFALHGAEANGFLKYANDLLRERGQVLGNKRPHYEACLGSLVRIVDSIYDNPHRYPALAMQQFVNDTCTHLHALEQLGLVTIPKHHMLIEMASRPLVDERFQ